MKDYLKYLAHSSDWRKLSFNALGVTWTLLTAVVIVVPLVLALAEGPKFLLLYPPGILVSWIIWQTLGYLEDVKKWNE